MGDLEQWRFVSYQKIGNFLLELVQNKGSDFNTQVVKAYAETIILIDNLFHTVLEAAGDNMPNYSNPVNIAEIYNEMSDIRLEDICKKLLADRFAKKIQNDSKFKELKERVKEKGFKLCIWSDFYNKRAVVDVRLVKEYEKYDKEILLTQDTEIALGIQIEGEQYRRVAQRRTSETTKDKCDDIYEDFLNYKWFQKYETDSKIIFEEKTHMSKGFNQ